MSWRRTRRLDAQNSPTDASLKSEKSTFLVKKEGSKVALSLLNTLKIKKRRKKKAKRRRTALFQDGVGALSVAAFLFLGATIREVNLLMALGASFAGFAALDYWGGRRTLRRLRVARILPDAIFAGEPFDVEIEIDASERRSSAWGLVVEDVWTAQKTLLKSVFSLKSSKLSVSTAQTSGNSENSENTKGKATGRKERKRRKRQTMPVGELGKEETMPAVAATLRPTAYFPRVRGGERRRERYGGLVAVRGVRRLETLIVSTRFPCGFFRSSERFDAPAEILVFPKIGVLTERGNALVGGASTQKAALPTARTSRVQDETLTIRDWRLGDSKKAIHWRATAKRNELQAREFEKRDDCVAVLILDLFFDETSANGAKNREKPNKPAVSAGWDGDGDSGKEEKEKKEKEERNWEERRKSDAVRASADEELRRAETVEAAVSFAATTLDCWARSNAKFLLAINGDFADESATDGAIGSVGAGGGVLRRALARLATVEPPRRDRLAELAAAIDLRTLADASVFVVSVAPIVGDRGRTWLERRSPARFVDVSASDFREFFQY